MDFSTVTTHKLVKLYGSTRALTGVSLGFAASCVTSLEGANGSGKSTLLSLLALLSRPTRGEIRFDDRALVDDRGRKRAPRALLARIGMLGHEAMLYPDLGGRQNLELSARLYGLEPHTCVAEIAERFDLGRWAERRVRTLSRGQRQRLSLARALLHRPRLLLLDEPSTGLDSAATESLVKALAAERRRGAIVVLVSHDPLLIDRLADRRIRLARGQVVEAA
ncbi:MAG: ATP-binding cassette domain-containing protein [Proteobacteria bacterium]|nr:ATP-binding cassette domain-containing protein [Pseudomonadota bacterium]